MPSDDVSGLFAENPKGPALPATFRQAVLKSFDADDGSNTVQIGTSELTDLPLARTGAEIGLESGDNILVMYLGNTPMIFCAIASVGGPNYGASNSGRAGFVVNSPPGINASAAGVTVISTSTIVVPGWAHSALLSMSANASLHNGTASLDNINSQVFMFSGAGSDFSGGANVAVPAGFIGATYASFQDVVGVVPGETLTFTYKLTSGTTWPVDGGAIATMTASLQFFREERS